MNALWSGRICSAIRIAQFHWVCYWGGTTCGTVLHLVTRHAWAIIIMVHCVDCKSQKAKEKTITFCAMLSISLMSSLSIPAGDLVKNVKFVVSSVNRKCQTLPWYANNGPYVLQTCKLYYFGHVRIRIWEKNIPAPHHTLSHLTASCWKWLFCWGLPSWPPGWSPSPWDWARLWWRDTGGRGPEGTQGQMQHWPSPLVSGMEGHI